MPSKNDRLESLSQLLLQFKKQISTKLNEKMTGDITISQLIILKNIKLGFDTVSDLANKLAITPPAVSKLADQLFTSGFVERTRSHQDRRIVHLKITSKGIDSLDVNEKIRNEMLKEIISQLTDEEMNTIIEALNKITNYLD